MLDNRSNFIILDRNIHVLYIWQVKIILELKVIPFVILNIIYKHENMALLYCTIC